MKNINKLNPIIPLVIVKTLKGRGVKPAKKNVPNQNKIPALVDNLSCKAKTFSS